MNKERIPLRARRTKVVQSTTEKDVWFEVLENTVVRIYANGGVFKIGDEVEEMKSGLRGKIVDIPLSPLRSCFFDNRAYIDVLFEKYGTEKIWEKWAHKPREKKIFLGYMPRYLLPRELKLYQKTDQG